MCPLREFVIKQQNNHIQSAFFPEASVANSLQNFAASPEEKFGRWGIKFGPLVIFTLWRNLGLKKHYFCLCEWKNKNISCNFLDLEGIGGGKQFFKSSASFRPFLFKIGVCQAAPLFIRPFLTMRPNYRPNGSTDCSAAFTTSFFSLVWKFAEIDSSNNDKFCL